MDTKTIEQVLINHNRVMSAVYQSLSDLDWERERDYFAEELKLEERSYNRDRY
jgi:hypothetical protein